MKTNITWFNAASVIRMMTTAEYDYYVKSNSWMQLYRRPSKTFLSDTITYLDNRMHQSRSSATSEYFHPVTIADKYIVPEKSTVNLDWDTVTYNRYCHILEAAKSKKGLLVEWSGGLDSTFIIAALIKYGDKNLWDNTKIYFNEYSVDENPYFARDVIKNYFSNVYDSTEYALQRMQNENDGMLRLTGAGGDRICASEIGMRWLLQYGNKDFSFANNKTNIFDFISKSHTDAGNASNQLIYDAVVDTADQFKIDIDTVGDFFWWWDYNFNTFDLYGFARLCNIGTDIVKLTEGTLGWFETKEYQQWALQNYQTNLFADYRDGMSHIQHRRVIYDVDKNDFYYKFKNKVKSISTAVAIYNIKKINQGIPLWFGTDYTAHLCDPGKLVKESIELGLIRD